MAELALEQVPRDGEIVEVMYRLSRSTDNHVDLTVSTDGTLRRLRFNGARVVMFQEEPPPVLQGLDVQDIREQQIRDVSLWVSVAEGAITFWAKTITEMTEFKPRPESRASHEEDVPAHEPEKPRNWSPGDVSGTFHWRRAPGGALRAISVGTHTWPGRLPRR